jgi:hypothetical protein
VGGHGEQDISKYSLVLPDGIIHDAPYWKGRISGW